jgi:hypothetical protein
MSAVYGILLYRLVLGMGIRIIVKIANRAVVRGKTSRLDS